MQSQIRNVLCIFLLFNLIAQNSQAQKTWNGSNGNWSDPNKWIPAGVPNTSDDVYINGGNVTLNVSDTILSMSISGGLVAGDVIVMTILDSLHISGGTYYTQQKTEVHGDLIWTGGTLGTLILNADSTIVLGKTDVLPGTSKTLYSHMYSYGGGKWLSDGSGNSNITTKWSLWNIIGNNTFVIDHDVNSDYNMDGGGSSFNAYCPMEKIGAGHTTFKSYFQMSDTLTLLDGKIKLNGQGGSMSGQIKNQVHNGLEFLSTVYDAYYNFDGLHIKDSAIWVDNGRINVQMGSSLPETTIQGNAIINVNNTLDIRGNLMIMGGDFEGSDTLTILDDCDFEGGLINTKVGEIHGDLNWTGGDIGHTQTSGEKLEVFGQTYISGTGSKKVGGTLITTGGGDWNSTSGAVSNIGIRNGSWIIPLGSTYTMDHGVNTSIDLYTLQLGNFYVNGTLIKLGDGETSLAARNYWNGTLAGNGYVKVWYDYVNSNLSPGVNGIGSLEIKPEVNRNLVFDTLFIDVSKDDSTIVDFIQINDDIEFSSVSHLVINEILPPNPGFIPFLKYTGNRVGNIATFDLPIGYTIVYDDANKLILLSPSPSCGESFTDNGGSVQDYKPLSNDTLTVCPYEATSFIGIDFTQFETETNDFLSCYNGNQTFDSLFWMHSGNGLPSVNPVVSYDSTGCLTFVFNSDASIEEAGWESNITCHPCIAPFDLKVSFVDATSAFFNWKDTSFATHWDLEIISSDQEPTGIPNYEVTDTFLNWSEGTGGTKYEIYLRADCMPFGGLVKSPWIGPYSFITVCDPDHMLPYYQDFNDHGNCWRIENVDNDQVTHGIASWERKDVGRCTQHFTDEGLVIADWYNGGGSVPEADDWAYSPMFSFEADTVYELSFQFGIQAFQQMRIMVLDTNHSSGATTGQEIFKYEGTDFFCRNEQLIFSVPHSGNYHISIHGYTSGTEGKEIAIDDFRLQKAPACAAPKYVRASNIRPQSVRLDFAQVNGTSYDWDIVPAGMPPGVGNGINGNTSNSFIEYLDGLTADTWYDVYVRTNCAGGPTAWSDSTRFKTLKDYCGDFFYDVGGPTGGYYNNMGDTTVICPPDTNQTVTVEFLEFLLDAPADRLRCFDGPTAAHPLIFNHTGTHSLPNPARIIASDSSGCLTFTFGSNYIGTLDGWKASVKCSACEDPDSLGVKNKTTIGADIYWRDNAGANLCDIEIVESGDTSTGIPTYSNVTSNPFTWTEGEVGKDYTFYVRSQCSMDQDSSNWMASNQFGISCSGVASMPYFQDFNEHWNCWYVENVDNDQFTHGVATWERKDNGPCQYNLDEGLVIANWYNEADDWAHSPMFYFETDTVYELSFKFGIQAFQQMRIMVLDTNHSSGAASGQEIFKYEGTDFFCRKEQLIFSVPQSGNYHISIHGYTSGIEGKAIGIDDFQLQKAPVCAVPKYVRASNIRPQSVRLDFAQVNGTSYDWDVVPAGMTPGVGNGINGNTSNSFIEYLDGLTADTWYDVYVRTNCVGGPTAWSDSTRFKTLKDYCGDFFYDVGGPTGGYYNNMGDTIVICPSDTNQTVTVEFLEFLLDAPADRLRCFDGPTAAHPLIFNHTGTHSLPNPARIIASDSSGCLTFTFGSNYIGTLDGWKASVKCSVCEDPDSLGVKNKTTFGADLYWRDNAGANLWDIEIVESGGTSTGIPTFSNVTSNPFTWTEGEAGKGYTFFVRSQCSMDQDSSNWMASNQFGVSCSGGVSMPYFQDFNEHWNCWHIENVDNDQVTHGIATWERKDVGRCTQHFTDEGLVIADWYNGGGSVPEADDWAHSPMFSFEADTVYELSFQFGVQAFQQMRIMILDTNHLSGATTGQEIFKYEGTDFFCRNEQLIFSVPQSGNYHISIHGYTSGAEGKEIGIDDFRLQKAPACAAPEYVRASNIRPQSVRLDFAQVNGTSYDWDIVPAGMSPGVGNGINGNTSNSIIEYLDGLTADTWYDVYVRANCAGGPTAWSDSTRFKTLKDYCGDFFYDVGGPTGGYYNNMDDTIIICPPVAGQQITIEFLEFSTDSPADRLFCYDGPTTTHPLIFNHTGTHGLPTPARIISSDSSGCITFIFDTNYIWTSSGWKASVTCTNCEDPDSLGVTNSSETGIDLYWRDNTGALEWNIEIIDIEEPATGVPTFTNVTTNPFRWSGGIPGKGYRFNVQAVCNPGDSSNWIQSNQFNYNCPESMPIPYFQNFDNNLYCWKIENVDNDYTGNGDVSTWKRIKSGCTDYTDDYTLNCFYFFGNPLPSNDWSFSPAFYFEKDSVYEISYQTSGGSLEELNVYVVDTNHSSATYNFEIYESNFKGVCENVVLTYTATFSGTHHIGFHSNSNFFGDKNLSIDDFKIRKAPKCIDVFNIIIEEITNTTVDFSFAPINGTHYYEWEIVTAGMPIGNGLQGSSISNEVDDAGLLTENTWYDLYVRSVCEQEETDWIGPIGFKTQVEKCLEKYFDPGGPNGFYWESYEDTVTFCPNSSGDSVIVDFIYFLTQDYDFLSCFDGPTVYHPRLWIHDGNELPPINPVISTHESGCLTFIFDSDYTGNASGWEADVTCGEISTLFSICDTVLSKADNGPGSLRNVIACAENGDTIYFSQQLNGDTLLLTGGPINIHKDLTFMLNSNDDITIKLTNTTNGLKFAHNSISEVRYLKLQAGAGSIGAIIKNEGQLLLEEVEIDSKQQNIIHIYNKGNIQAKGNINLIKGN